MTFMDKIYFDYASTTPVDQDVVNSMMPYFYNKFGNASSPHALGREVQKALEDSRLRLAQFIGAKPQEVIFNSGATEGNNHAIYGCLNKSQHSAKHIIVSSIEHHSVLEPIEYLRKLDVDITYLPVDSDGLVSPSAVLSAIREETILIIVMHANNEIGTIQPIAEIAQIAKHHNIPFLVDACQTVGHIPVNVSELQCDFLTLSAHKFYGPKGVGALYVREGMTIEPFLLGGNQERNQRASTQNVAGIVGLAKAVDICDQRMNEEMAAQAELRNFLIKHIPEKIPQTRINGHLTSRLPNNVHLSFEGIEGESLLMSLDMNGICASMGSACAAGSMEASHVLKAIGISEELAYGSLRITLGRWTTRDHIDKLLAALPGLVAGLR